MENFKLVSAINKAYGHLTYREQKYITAVTSDTVQIPQNTQLSNLHTITTGLEQNANLAFKQQNMISAA